MINTILSNYVYATIFYFLVFIPFYTLILLPSFCRLQKRISGLEKSSISCFFYFYASLCIISLFAASLSYFLLVTNTRSFYFLIHFFIIIPLVSLLSSCVISRIGNKKRLTDYILDLGIFLTSFSLFTSFIYMGLKLHINP
ncbi:Putative membrane protein [Criblamydia sequanensis CRIB-18]|uniref:Membrane protein n=1 Tax=Candidatus Criblamydia sequanensis CRIB-18 TaxID=1437425 RepID=A0A090CYV9_9BACT|nr:Putative membrane protein [Criblamydia sequanensis CRIB-18]